VTTYKVDSTQKDYLKLVNISLALQFDKISRKDKSNYERSGVYWMDVDLLKVEI